jgi:peptidoglycan/LPS O-acetylase OafA/YrhL
MLFRLGDASYSIYVGHLFPVIGFRIIWIKLHLPIGYAIAATLFLFLCLSVGIALGCILYLLAERPVSKLLAAALKRRQAAASAWS